MLWVASAHAGAQERGLDMYSVCSTESTPVCGGECDETLEGQLPRPYLPSLYLPFCPTVFLGNKILLLDGFEWCPLL